jgi:hypothetical protein
MTGNYGVTRSKSYRGSTEIYVRIAPGQSVIVQTCNERMTGSLFQYFDAAGNQENMAGTWKVTFAEGGPSIPPVSEVTELKSWTDFGGEAYKDFSGTAEYSIRFSRPHVKADSWLLDLGKVCESARVFLNGKEIAGLIGPVFTTLIDKSLIKPDNDLIIKVSNLSANRIAWLDRNNVNWKKFYNTNYPARLPQNRKNGLFDASAWAPRESGLIGPVTLTPVKRYKR